MAVKPDDFIILFHVWLVKVIDCLSHEKWRCCIDLVAKISIFFGGGSSHDELPELAHWKAPEKSLGIKDQSCTVLRLSHKTVW